MTNTISSKYPFLTPFTIVEVGGFYFLKCGGIRVKEQIEMESSLSKLLELRLCALELGQKIFEETGKPIEVVEEFLNNPLGDRELLLKYGKEINELLKIQKVQNFALEETTIFIRHRGILPENLETQVVGIPDWGLKDTEALTYQSYEAIKEFISEERNAVNAEKELTEEKKASRKRSPRLSNL